MKIAKDKIIAIGKILSFLLVPLFVYLFIVNSSLTAVGPAVGVYVPSDEETNYLTALSVYRGEPLYQNFSISYPPGRFLAQALFFHLTTPSVISARIYMNLFAPLLFPTLLFFLTYRVLRVLKLTFFPAYLLGSLALLMDLTLVHSAQEVHALIAAFGLVLLSRFRPRQLVLGIFLGLIFLFRFEAGIIVSLALLCSYRCLPSRLSLLSFSLVWLPILFHLIFHGTIINFLYDTIILGLLTQPRVMGQAIPPNDLWYVFLSSLVLLFGLALSLWQHEEKPLRAIAGIALLSYVTALGRSDEGHLWYGLIWLPLLISYGVTQFSRPRLSALLFGLAVTLFPFFLISVKSPAIFLLATAMLLALPWRFPRFSPHLAWGGIICALLIFHSFRYFSLRFQIPRYAGIIAHPWTQVPANNSIGGLNFPDPILTSLAEIKTHITGPDPYLFIFPENTLYYEYFHLPRPTRYLYLIGERTSRTEAEIIRDLSNTPNLYVLVFPEKALARGGDLWTWIQDNTNLLYSTTLQNKPVELYIVE